MYIVYIVQARHHSVVEEMTAKHQAEVSLGCDRVCG